MIKYDEKLLISLPPGSQLLTSLESQKEFLPNGTQLSQNYIKKDGDLTNKNPENDLNDNTYPNNHTYLSRSWYSPSSNFNESGSVALNRRTYETNIIQVQPKNTLMVSQEKKTNNINQSSKINISLGTNTSMHIPKKDNKPDVDCEIISEKIIEEDDYE